MSDVSRPVSGLVEPSLADGDIAVAVAMIRDALVPIPVNDGEAPFVVTVPDGWKPTLVDPEALSARPRRVTGTVNVFNVASFLAVCATAEDKSDVIVYADETKHAVTAVLNDSARGLPAWRDHRVALQLRQTPEWAYRKAHQGLTDQQSFAESIEHGADEIRVPGAAEMLTIAETFVAKIDVNFKQGADLGRGARQITFEENVSASAGKGGSLTIPEAMELAVIPFVGTDVAFKVPAKIRFRLRDGKLQIGYTLHRPDEVERLAFLKSVAGIAASLNVVTGEAPAARLASKPLAT